MSRNPYARLERAVEASSKPAVLTALAGLSDHAKDLLVECDCGAKEREECIGTKLKIVHFGRRLKRLLKGIR